MGNELNIIETKSLNQKEKTQLCTAIDNAIEKLHNNRQEINKLVFESVAAMTEADDAQKELSRKGTLERWIGSITGSNQKLQNKINSNRSASQYAAQLTLQKLAEQNLMTFDLIATVNNNLNVSLLQVNEEFKNIYEGLKKFLRYNRNKLVQFETRLKEIEKKVDLIKWKDLIDYQDFDGIEYSDLDNVSKIVCLTRDFYDITKGNWTTEDLLYLRKTMKEVRFNPKEKVNYFDVLKSIALNKNLKDKFWGNMDMRKFSQPDYLITTTVLKKFDSLEHEESCMVETLVNTLKENGIDVTPEDKCADLTIKYFEKERMENLNVNVASYDLMLDLLFNLQQIDIGLESKKTVKAENNQDDQPLVLTEMTGSNNNKEVDKSRTSKIEATDDNNTQDEETIDMKDEAITTIQHIKADECREYNNKNIHLSAYINCEGILEFNHCVIYYNETKAVDKVTLSNNASLIIKNSLVICKGFDENPFIKGEGNNTVVFEDTTFEDCSYFVECTDCSKFYMTRCALKDCYDKFIRIDKLHDVASSGIIGNLIYQSTLKEFLPVKEIYWPKMITVDTKNKQIFRFYNNKIIEEENFIKKIEKKAGDTEDNRTFGSSEFKLFVSDNAEINNCSFDGINCSVYAHETKKSVFKNCKNGLCAYYDQDVTDRLGLVDNCTFINSTNIISVSKLTVIQNCQFVSCYDRLINIYNKKGENSIKYCQFINTKCKRESVINFSCDKHTVTNKIKKSIFDGIDLTEGYIISCGNDPEYEDFTWLSNTPEPADDIVDIEECDFRNCITNVEDGNVIDGYVYWTSGFFSNSEKKDVVNIINCRGLDKINKEGKEANIVEIKTKSTEGEPIGNPFFTKASVAATAAAYVIGGPLAAGAVLGYKIYKKL